MRNAGRTNHTGAVNGIDARAASDAIDRLEKEHRND